MLTVKDIPTMPEPCIYEGDASPMYDAPTGYTSEQMKSYGQQCREAALEEAAIDAERNGHLWSGAPSRALFNLAEQIRSLK